MALDLPLTESAALLRDALHRYLADHPRPGWQGLAGELGLMSVGIPENDGGSGGGAVERALVMEALGPALAGDGWLTHALGTAALASVAPGHALLPLLASGEQRIALCRADCLALVAGAAEADWLLVTGDAEVLLIAADAPGMERRVRTMRDGTRVADISIGHSPSPDQVLARGDEAAALDSWAGNALLAGRCAEGVGLMQRMLDDTAGYLVQRKQFGVPISSFQVLRHRMADMQMALMKATALAERAVLTEGGADWPRTVHAAAVEVGEALRTVGEGAVQLHGAMGLTEELSLGALFKRGLAIAAGLGPVSGHLAAYAAA